MMMQTGCISIVLKTQHIIIVGDIRTDFVTSLVLTKKSFMKVENKNFLCLVIAEI